MTLIVNGVAIIVRKTDMAGVAYGYDVVQQHGFKQKIYSIDFVGRIPVSRCRRLDLGVCTLIHCFIVILFTC